MSHGSGKRDIELLSADGTGCSCSAGDISSSCTENGSIEALGTACAEFHDRPSFGSPDDPRGLCSDQRLMVDRAKECRLKELCLDNGSSYLDKGFPREHYGSLGDRPYVTSKFKVSEVFNELVTEVIIVLEEFQVSFGEMEVGQIIDNLLHTGHYGISAALRYISEECIEIHDGIAASVIEITVCHGQLIEIREHAHVGSFIPHTVVHIKYLRGGFLD